MATVSTYCLKGDKSFCLQQYFLKPSFLQRVRCASHKGACDELGMGLRWVYVDRGPISSSASMIFPG